MTSMDYSSLTFKKTHKKNYDVYVCMPYYGAVVQNILACSTYETSTEKPFVISGTVGETWVIDFDKLIKTYEFMDGSAITKEALSKRVKNGVIDWMHLKTKSIDKQLYFAAFLPLDQFINLPVQTFWGDVLLANRQGISHGKGDFLVCASNNGRPNYEDIWVVNGEIFPTTYDMRAFPGFGSMISSRVTPIPASFNTEPAVHPNTNESNLINTTTELYSNTNEANPINTTTEVYPNTSEMNPINTTLKHKSNTEKTHKLSNSKSIKDFLLGK